MTRIATFLLLLAGGLVALLFAMRLTAAAFDCDFSPFPYITPGGGHALLAWLLLLAMAVLAGLVWVPFGLIGYVVPDGSALDKALEIAEVISNNGPLAVQAILRSIHETEGMHENDAFKIDTKIGIEVFLSEDAKEGPLAFKEKRAPQFKMR